MRLCYSDVSESKIEEGVRRRARLVSEAPNHYSPPGDKGCVMFPRNMLCAGCRWDRN